MTLSGKLRYAYVNNSSNTAGTIIEATGIARTDGDLVVTATEDLGGGLKASANFAIQTGARSVASANRDGNLFLSGGFGTVAFGSIDAGNGIQSLGGAGASYLPGLDSLVTLDSGNVDYLSYTTPTISGFAGKITMIDDATATSGTNSATGYSQNSTTALQDAMVYGVTYAAGPLSVAADITAYGNNSIAAATARSNGRTRISASYDLGVAKIGAGFETRTAATSSTATELKTNESIIGVNVPFGSFDIGLNYAKSTTDGDGYSKSGFDVGARYNLSKRTYVFVGLQSVNNVNLNGTAGSTNEGSFSRIQLAHSF